MSKRYLPVVLAAAIWMPSAFCETDPSDMFLRGYQEFQAAERSERQGQVRDALNRYATAAKIFESVQRTDPEWQKMVLEYRLRKTQESLDRLRISVSEAQMAVIEVEDPLPTGGFEINIPEPMVSTRPPGGSFASVQSVKSNEEALKLQSNLAKAQRQIDSLKKDLENTKAELTGAKASIDRTKSTLVEARSELAQAKATLENVTAERDLLKSIDAKASDKRFIELAARIEKLEADNEVLNDENTRLTVKLQKAGTYIEESEKVLAATNSDRLALASERDKALASLSQIQDKQKEIDRLLKERSEMESKFAFEKQAFEKQIADQKPKLDLVEKLGLENKNLSARLEKAELALKDSEKIKADQGLREALQEEVGLLKKRLAAARGELKSRDESIKSLHAQLEEAAGVAARIRLNPNPTTEMRQVAEENELLKKIVLRQIKEQNERTQAVGVLEQELEKLFVKSDTLSSQLAVLSKPPAKFSDREMLIFRDPIVLLNEPGEVDMSVSMTVSKSSPRAPEAPSDVSEGAEVFDPQARQLVEKAAELVRDRRFTDAEKIYQKLTDEYPDNYFALSNLAVTQIHAGKFAPAQVALEKVLRLEPGDVFASVLISNVHCRLGRYDEAVEVLKEVIKKDPRNAVAHNYLAIALGKQGNAKQAEEYFQRSILLDGNYSNAHFNLAVMYANTEPPSLKLARKHYDLAKSLGSEPDPVMEHRLGKAPLASESP